MATTEERLAALEKQMAAWINQQPTTYYTHQYSGEEIDAAVGRAVTGGALDTSVTNVSNQLGTFVRPNLLDNWYFGNPVNQRGQTEYLSNWVYGLDRWLNAGDGKSYVETGCCKFFGAIDQGLGLQKSDIAGRTITASVLLTDGTLISGTATDTDSSADIPFVSGVHNIYIGLNSTDLSGHRRFRLYFGTELSAIAAKIELGPTQTLAHQENGVWVLNEVPEYGEQLRRCQRYYLVTAAKQFFQGWAISSSTGFILVPIPAQMRATPIINVLYGGTFIQNGVSASLTANNFELENADAVGLKIKLNGLNCSVGPFALADALFAFSSDL